MIVMPEEKFREVRKNAYHKYQLAWMSARGLSASDLSRAVLQYAAEENSDPVDPDTLMEAWEAGVGFDGSIWACFEEFLDTEYQDADYMASLLSHAELEIRKNDPAIKRVYLLEIGTANTDKSHKDYSVYADVYDKAYAYFDESQNYSTDLEEVKKVAEETVKNGGENTYAIISVTDVDPSLFSSEEDLWETPVEGEPYDVENVVFSMIKKHGNVVMDFIQKSA